jgi:threonine dehydratase
VTATELEAAEAVVYRHMTPTAQIRWPLLSRRCGCEVWVKHENHAPTGAFKVRGGLVYLDELSRTRPDVPGVIAATRGNHGQSVAFAAACHGLRAVIVVPHGNNPEKNAAIEAFGAELIEHGHDFQAAYDHARELVEQRGLHLVPTFHPRLVPGVATYALELFRAAPELDTVYVPIGLGSGICGVIRTRDRLGLRTRVVGVVAEKAPTYALSFARRAPVPTESADTIADGVAIRVPDEGALEIICRGAERVVTVPEEAILDAMSHYLQDTHNLVEGAGAAPLAALLQEGPAAAGKRVGLVVSGGNVDRALLRRVVAGTG